MCKGKYYSFPCDHCQEEWTYCRDAKRVDENGGIIVNTRSVNTEASTPATSSTSSPAPSSSTPAATSSASASSSSSTPTTTKPQKMRVYIGEATETLFEKGSRMLPCSNAIVDVIENDDTVKCEEPECRVTAY